MALRVLTRTHQRVEWFPSHGTRPIEHAYEVQGPPALNVGIGCVDPDQEICHDRERLECDRGDVGHDLESAPPARRGEFSSMSMITSWVSG